MRNSRISNLRDLPADSLLETDIAIVGSGPAGMSLAQEFFGTNVKILILESGEQHENAIFDEFNRLEWQDDSLRRQRTQDRRLAMHGPSSKFWRPEVQPFGGRARVFGGTSQVWAGKSAPLDEDDFRKRAWVPHSGWPFERSALEPYIARGADLLGLGPLVTDEALWTMLGLRGGSPIGDARVRSFFWQFARSKVNRLDVMRFGDDFAHIQADNVEILMNATVTEICTNREMSRVDVLRISTVHGVQSQVKANVVVIAAGAIENARLLLLSRGQSERGVGNERNLVGRYLMDHPGAQVGSFAKSELDAATSLFGFYGLKKTGKTHMYSHGLTLTPSLQSREGLMNCALYALEDRAPNDPWDALKRLARGRSPALYDDVLAVASSPGLLATGFGRKMLQTRYMPRQVVDAVVSTMIANAPNFVAREYRSHGLPHKLAGVSVHVICEQPPDPENRIELSESRDALGQPRARVRWRVGDEEKRSLIRLAKIAAEDLGENGLSAPSLSSWIVDGRPQDGDIIDMCHTSGTTRMSDDPHTGVVDRNCRVHGVDGLYITGSSVFPTCGHANPTLTIVALAIRLADHIKANRLH